MPPVVEGSHGWHPSAIELASGPIRRWPVEPGLLHGSSGSRSPERRRSVRLLRGRPLGQAIEVYPKGWSMTISLRLPFENGVPPGATDSGAVQERIAR